VGAVETAGHSRKPTRVTLRSRGAALGGTGIALLAAGLWRVDGQLAALGLAALVLLGLAAVMARFNGAAADVSLELPDRVEAGREFPARIAITNRHGWLDAFGLRLTLELARGTRIASRVAWLTAGSHARIDVRLALPQRGIIGETKVTLITDAPFGFFETKRTFAVAARMVVVPKPVVPRGLVFSAGPLDLHEDDPMTSGGGPGELRGLREWRPGDPVKRVSWPATVRAMARGAGWVVWETDPPGFRPARFVLVAHSFGADRGLIQPERFERAMCHAAGILRLLHAQGMPARMIADFDDWRPRPAARPAQLAECMEILAAARRAAGTEAHDLHAALTEIHPDEGVIILSDMPLAAWRPQLPPVMRRAITPDIPARRSRKEVGA
jgi:uncharacterized protein (DUF58 family)